MGHRRRVARMRVAARVSPITLAAPAHTHPEQSAVAQLQELALRRAARPGALPVAARAPAAVHKVPVALPLVAHSAARAPAAAHEAPVALPLVAHTAALRAAQAAA